VYAHVFTDQTLTDLQLLLGVRHNVLLRCVFECILTFFEWIASKPNKLLAGGRRLSFCFANSFTVDILLLIIESFSDDFRKLAAEALTYMIRDESEGGTADILRLFKELGGCEKLIGLMTSTSSDSVRARLIICF